MKKLTLIFFSTVSIMTFAQTNNTLPTNGNVGVGTTTPTTKLEVNGNMKVDSCIIVADSAIMLKSARIGETLKVEGQIYTPNMNSTTEVSSKEIVFIDEAGFLLKGDTDEAIEFMGQQLYQLSCSSNGGVVLNPVWNNGPNKIFNSCPEVNVGINTSSPRVKLDVIGATSTNTLVVGADPLTTIARAHITDPRISAAGTTLPVLIVENTQRQLMNLDNTGLLRTREVKVDAQSWPDYVFEQEYVLMPLEQVEAFIAENGHLPNVPSAEKIETEGQSLGDMNKILLEKIEELTLHMIEQQKQIELLKHEIHNK